MDELSEIVDRLEHAIVDMDNEEFQSILDDLREWISIMGS
jgi:putative heme iron utilization protein